MSELLSLFLLLFRLGLFTFGSGIAIIPLIQQELVSRGLLTLTESIDLIAIAQMTPGPFVVNASTFAGMHLYGLGGAALATLGITLPSVILCLVAARFFFAFRTSRLMHASLRGMRPVILALIASAILTLGGPILFPGGTFSSIDWPVLGIAAVGSGILIKTRSNPIYVILAGAAIGVAFLH
jgi:chromate transporter